MKSFCTLIYYRTSQQNQEILAFVFFFSFFSFLFFFSLENIHTLPQEEEWVWNGGGRELKIIDIRLDPYFFWKRSRHKYLGRVIWVHHCVIRRNVCRCLHSTRQTDMKGEGKGDVRSTPGMGLEVRLSYNNFTPENYLCPI